MPVIWVVDPSLPVTVTTWSGPSAAPAVEHLDLAALAHRGDATDEAGDDLLLALLGHLEVDARRAGLDAELGGVGDVAVHGGRLEERLGRDAAPVEARAAEGVDLDEGHLHPGGRGVERSRVATRASTDDDEIELIGRRDHLFSASRSSARAAPNLLLTVAVGRQVDARSQRTRSSPRWYSRTRLDPASSARRNARVHGCSCTVVAPQWLPAVASASSTIAGDDEAERRRSPRRRRRRRSRRRPARPPAAR